MPQFVGQMFFNTISHGWSETYYPDGDTYDAAGTTLQSLRDFRLAMLCSDVQCVYARISDTGIKGDSILLTGTYPISGGISTSTTYQEPLAVLCREQAGSLYRAQRWIKGIPSSCVSGTGLFAPTSAWSTAFDGWQSRVVGQTWLRVRSKTDVARPIIYAHVTSLAIINLRGRKYGRPFGLSRGRQLIS